MKDQAQGQIKMNEGILDSVTRGTKVYILEKRANNLFLIRDNTKTISMSTTEEAARAKFAVYKSSTEKGGDKDIMSGQDKFQEAGAKLKAEKAAAEEKAVAAAEQVKGELATLQANSKLASMYNDAANVGAENIGGQSLPVLRIHAAGKSTNNELEDGGEPADGHFYYKPTKEDLGDEIEVHILTISRGFKTAPMEGSDKEYTFNQIVGGIIGNDKPFVMYFNGTKLQNLWNFGKEAGQYTRRKPVAFPMFSLTVRLKTMKGEKGKYAAPWIVGFEILRNEDRQPQLILDEGLFQYLKDNVSLMEETIANVIAAKELKAVISEKEEEPIIGEAVHEDVPPPPDDIPFN